MNEEEWIQYGLSALMRLSSNQRYALKTAKLVNKSAEKGISLTRVHVCVFHDGFYHKLQLDYKSRYACYQQRISTGPYKKKPIEEISSAVVGMLKAAIDFQYYTFH